jgi:hypothetical protein
MLNELREMWTGVNDLEKRMCEYSEMNSFLFSHNKMFMITSNFVYKTPEYNFQPYTFKYGDYQVSDYMENYS